MRINVVVGNICVHNIYFVRCVNIKLYANEVLAFTQHNWNDFGMWKLVVQEEIHKQDE